MKLLSELKRRNVLRAATVYVVTAWLVMQVVGVLMDLVTLPEWIGTATLWLLAIGFPIALAISWFYEITPDGIAAEDDLVRGKAATPNNNARFNLIVIAILASAVLLFAYDKWWAKQPPGQSIAVLAFENMSADPDQEYFSDGISEEVLNLLAQIPELTVISRSSAFVYKNQDVSIPYIAEQLNVAHVLEGSVRKHGNRVRITAQLIEASSDSHLWSETYDRDLSDILVVQSEIAAAISAALQMELAPGASDHAQTDLSGAASLNAYDAYLRARELIASRDEQSLRDAITLLERAIGLDSNFAPAFTQLAIAHALMFSEAGAYTHEQATRLATPYLDRALELDPELADAHAARALLALSVEPLVALEHARKALAINANQANALYWSSLVLRGLGDYDAAAANLEKLLQVDPRSYVGRAAAIYWTSDTGEFDKTHAMIDKYFADDPQTATELHADILLNRQGEIAKALETALAGGALREILFPVFMRIGEYQELRRLGFGGQLWAEVSEGSYDRAITESQRFLRQNPDDRRAIWQVAEFLYQAGLITEALPHYERLRQFVPEGRSIPTSIADHRSSQETMMRLAMARRVAGDDNGAAAAAEIVRQELERRAAQGIRGHSYFRAATMLGAFDKQFEQMMSAGRSAIRSGLRDPSFFDDPIFGEFDETSGFIELRRELDAVLATEREKVLQLICLRNPAPDEWRPMPETCDDVE